MPDKKCIYCGDVLSGNNVYLFHKRKGCVDKCDNCTNKLERGDDMYD